MEALGDCAGLHLRRKLVARHAAAQADEELRRRIGVGDVPHLRLRLAAQRCRLGGGRMHLQRQRRARVENLAQQRKAAVGRWLRHSEHIAGVLFHQPADRPACAAA